MIPPLKRRYPKELLSFDYVHNSILAIMYLWETIIWLCSPIPFLLCVSEDISLNFPMLRWHEWVRWILTLGRYILSKCQGWIVAIFHFLTQLIQHQDLEILNLSDLNSFQNLILSVLTRLAWLTADIKIKIAVDNQIDIHNYLALSHCQVKTHLSCIVRWSLKISPLLKSCLSLNLPPSSPLLLILTPGKKTTT